MLLTGEPLPCLRGRCSPQPKPTKGKMRIHCLENVDKALQFLKEQRVHLENMGSHDIVDGNHRLVLGLIWTIILRFQVGAQGPRPRRGLPKGWGSHQMVNENVSECAGSGGAGSCSRGQG